MEPNKVRHSLTRLGCTNRLVLLPMFGSHPRLAFILNTLPIDIEYNKRLDHQQPCFEDELNGGGNNIVQSNKSV